MKNEIKTEMVRIDVSDNLTPAVNLPKSSPTRITEKFLKGSKLEYFHNSSQIAFDDDFQNQYVAALHNAFAEHYAFVLNPDDIWLLIMQGLSIHINLNAEKYRDVLVDFQGKKEIVVRHDGLVRGNDNNTWDLVFPIFESEISNLIKDSNVAKLIVPNFSTTTEIDKTCFRISLMDIAKSYFSYVVMTRCGIPTIYIDGKKEDWLSILGSINTLLPMFEMEAWAIELSQNIAKIIATYDGIVDKKFFESIYKYSSHSGGDAVTGWINDFFPYMVTTEGKTQKLVEKVLSNSPFARSGGPFLSTKNYPSSVCSVPFVWDYHGEKFNMNFFAGFCGFDESQNEAIRPRKNFFIAYEK
jgi:hypothetical protein